MTFVAVGASARRIREMIYVDRERFTEARLRELARSYVGANRYPF